MKSSNSGTSAQNAASDFDPQIYWEQRLTQNAGLLGVGFTMLGKRYNEWQYRLRRNVFLREMTRLNLSCQSANVLDIASGTGFYIRLWEQLGVRNLSGCDLTSVAVGNLRKNFPEVKFWQLDITRPKAFSADEYDVISAFDVLFHIVNDEGYKEAIRNIYSALKPGGIFVFSELFLHGERTAISHVVSRTLSEIQDLLIQTGFQIEKRIPVFITMNIPLDTNSRVLQFFWKVLSQIVRRSEVLGYAVGAVLYSLDSVLIRWLRESPTTELMICRKVS